MQATVPAGARLGRLLADLANSVSPTRAHQPAKWALGHSAEVPTDAGHFSGPLRAATLPARARHKLQVFVVLRFVQKDATEFLRQDHAATAILVDEPFSFGISHVAIRDKLDDAVSIGITNPIALLDRCARCVKERHGLILVDSRRVATASRLRN